MAVIAPERERVASSPDERNGYQAFEQDGGVPCGRVQTMGGWVIYIGDNRVWERQNGKPYQAKVGNFEVKVISEMKLVGSERLHVFTIEGVNHLLGTRVILAQHLDLDIIRRLR